MWGRFIVMRIRILRSICREGMVESGIRHRHTGDLVFRLGPEQFGKHRASLSNSWKEPDKFC